MTLLATVENLSRIRDNIACRLNRFPEQTKDKTDLDEAIKCILKIPAGPTDQLPQRDQATLKIYNRLVGAIDPLTYQVQQDIALQLIHERLKQIRTGCFEDFEFHAAIYSALPEIRKHKYFKQCQEME